MDTAKVVKALAALAQEHRLAAFRLLVQAGPDGLAAGALAEALGIKPSALSFHITQLAYAGLVTQRRSGRWVIYAADYGVMDQVMGFLTENCCAGAACAPAGSCTAETSSERND